MSTPVLELEDIQSGVLSPRPSPYVATYILLRIDERKVGRELMRKLSTVVASVGHQTSPAGDAWVSVSLSFQGLKALGTRTWGHGRELSREVGETTRDKRSARRPDCPISK